MASLMPTSRGHSCVASLMPTSRGHSCVASLMPTSRGRVQEVDQGGGVPPNPENQFDKFLFLHQKYLQWPLLVDAGQLR